MSKVLEHFRELENEIQALETDNKNLESQVQTLCDDKEELEQELEHYAGYYEDDENVIEKIHELYYTICEMTDNGKSIELDLLNDFFKKSIDKTV